MITPAYLQRMARYNRWQNNSLYTAADSLSDAERKQDRGAFHGSIHETLNHILWADRLWMSRLSDWDNPGGGQPESLTLYTNWDELKAARRDSDARFIRWADAITQDQIDGELTGHTTDGTPFRRNRALCMMQVFNHQTHHRGQVHAMLTAAGATPEDTDLPVMPEAYL